MELAASNRRLCSTEYIRGPADEQFFTELAMVRAGPGSVCALARKHRSLCLVADVEGIRAVAARESVAPPPPPGIDYNALLMGIAKELVTARGYIGTVIGHTGLGEARCLELLGLKREDIAYTDWPAKFAQYDDPQWEANKEAMEALAKRLLPVYRELQPLSEAALQTYFLERRVLKLEQQLAAMWPPKQE